MAGSRIRIHYQILGDGPKTVLFFHGWAMNGASWLPLAKRFPQNGWRLVMPDLRGFGRSDKPPQGYHIDDYMRDAVRLVRKLGTRPVDIIGHSFGGTGAIYLAARIPHLVRRLVVLDTIPGAANPLIDPGVARQFARIRALVERTRRDHLPTLLMRLWRQSFHLPPSDESLALQQEAVDMAEPHAILATLNTILTTDIGYWLSRVRVPTLVMQGAADPVLHGGPDGLDALSAERRIIPGTGHYPHLENPDGVLAHLLPFLGVAP
ncbi:alpha/beta fold hydrolase [Sulfobacillus harzensis]|uniref:Alpha/beta hydrolase n=1 Tax=Sulfobacillus harzensis TaxID=2729629 RepID=A0A7Y0L5E5_9FIRM|nr:alpha/beta hydrolase [Sulfobacillus harzensis]NMP23353.1 alpha/beta hydrolase [Sulfobacillus harzensis]